MSFYEEVSRHRGSYVTQLHQAQEKRNARVEFFQIFFRAAGVFCVVFSAVLLALATYGAAHV